MKKVLLKKPGALMSGYAQPHSLCRSLVQLFPYIPGVDYSYTEVMGYTGHAFHMNIEVTVIKHIGPMMYDWGGLMYPGLRNMGVTFRLDELSGYHEGIPDIQGSAIQLAKDAVNSGIPAISWEVLNNQEFGLMYGYDDETEMFQVVNAHGEGERPFTRLGLGPLTNILFVMQVSQIDPIDRKEALLWTLESALEYGYKYKDHEDWGGFGCGLEAYDLWIAAIQRDTVDPYGNAYMILTLLDAREQATRFLHQIAESDENYEDRLRDKLVDASVHYAGVVNALSQLASRFPFPQCGEPISDANKGSFIDQLLVAKANEERALLALAGAVELLKSKG